MILLRRIFLLAVFLAGTVFPAQAHAGIWTLNSGLASQRQADRDSDDKTNSLNLLTTVSYLSPEWEFALDLGLRWDTDGKEFDKTVWERRGDFLRPLKTLVYSHPEGVFSAGIEEMSNWTPGGGYLIRELSGLGEIDYILPGLRLKWGTRDLRIDVGTDRLIDPTVQAASLTWKPFGNIRILLEGALDPEAPESFTGEFSSGRPVAASTRRLTGSAAGILFPLRDGRLLDLEAGGHAARLGDDASGLGWELRVSLDWSPYYRNRLSFTAGSVQCSGGYVPAWFEAVYPVTRWGLSGQPLLEINPLDGTREERRLEMLEAGYELGNSFRIRGGIDRFTDNSMKRARFLLELRESGGRGLEAALWSQSNGPDEDLFTEDGNFFSRVSALYACVPHLLLRISYDHSWAFQEEKGGLVPLTSVLLGVMYNISL